MGWGFFFFPLEELLSLLTVGKNLVFYVNILKWGTTQYIAFHNFEENIPQNPIIWERVKSYDFWMFGFRKRHMSFLYISISPTICPRDGTSCSHPAETGGEGTESPMDLELGGSVCSLRMWGAPLLLWQSWGLISDNVGFDFVFKKNTIKKLGEVKTCFGSLNPLHSDWCRTTRNVKGIVFPPQYNLWKYWRNPSLVF